MEALPETSLGTLDSTVVVAGEFSSNPKSSLTGIRMDAKTMSDNSKRTVCRIAFLLLCALPLSLVVYKIFHPVTTNQWQQAIKADLGLVSRIGNIETPVPFVTQFSDIQLEDAELGQLVQLDRLKLIIGPTNEIVIDDPLQVNGASLIRIAQRLRDSLLRTHSASKSWRIRLNNLTIVQPQSPLTDPLPISSVEIAVNPYPTITITDIELKLANDTSDNTVRFSLRRNRDNNEVRETIELATGQSYVPCWLMHEILPDLNSFGPACSFAGFTKLEKGDDGWSGVVEGNFRQFDLASLVKPYQRNIEGLCDVWVPDCIIQNNKIKSITTELRCESGRMDVATALAADRFLGIKLVDQAAEDSNGVIEFAHLMFRAEVSEAGNFEIIGRETNRKGVLSDAPFRLIASHPQTGEPLLGIDDVYSYKLDYLPMFLAGDSDSTHAMNTKVDIYSRIHQPPVRVADEGRMLR